MKDFDLVQLSDLAQATEWARSISMEGDFPDPRLGDRCTLVLQALIEGPGKSYPNVFQTWSQTKGFYRFIENERTTEELLNEMVFRATVKKCETEKRVLLVSDTTSLNLGHLNKIPELGPINANSKSKGLHIHTTMALTENGCPIGVVDQIRWNRDRNEPADPRTGQDIPIEEKESYCWIQAIRATKKRFQEVYGDAMPQLVFIFDRGGDIHEVFEFARKENVDFVIRGKADRRIDNELKKLKATIKATPVIAELNITIPARLTAPARQATVSIQYMELIKLLPSRRGPVIRNSVTINAILIEEKNPPPSLDPKDVINWLLITSLPVTSLSDALLIKTYYSFRWRVEDFHLVLKSGCNIEKHQFETISRYEKAIVLASCTAAEILRMTYIARKEPNLPAIELFTQTECELICLLLKRPLYTYTSITVSLAVRCIACLGGYLNRKGDGPPGVRTLWKGLNDFKIMVRAFVLARSNPP